MAVCVAVIGKENSPKFVACLEEGNELAYHFKVHTSLDVIEEKLNLSKSSGGDSELYLGLLLATEDHTLYGYVTNTKVKFVIVFDSTHSSLRDNEIRAMFRKLHAAYTDVVCNPFYIPGETITSKKFNNLVREILTGS